MDNREGFAVMFILLSFHADSFLRQVMINFMAMGFLAFSYFCHKLLIWILAKREGTNSEMKNAIIELDAKKLLGL